MELRRLILISIPVGILAGLGVAGLEAACNRLLWDRLSQLPVPIRLAFPILGLLIAGWILARLGVRSVGLLNEVVVHYHAPPEHVAPGEDALKASACIATVGLGASAGLGGPSQWLGTRIALYLRHYLAVYRPLRGLSRVQMILIGAAAGVSAYFRAPLTGTLLALETPFSKDIDGAYLLPASVSALLAHLVHGFLLDNQPLLTFPNSATMNPPSLAGALMIGIAAGLLSRRFQRILAWSRDWTGRFTWPTRALMGGLLTSATALITWIQFRETWTLQGGLPLAQQVFNLQFIGWAALALLALKLVSVWATFGTTGVAGLLVVTLTVGSLLGAALHPLLPVLDVRTACAIAVCAYLAANYNAPMTGIALAAEWGGTGLLPLAWIAVLIAAWIGEGLANTPAKAGHRTHHPVRHH